MTWIHTIPEDKATGDLKRAYEEVARARGKVSNIMRAQSLSPAALRCHLELYVTLVFGKSGLSRGEREMIATAISAHNRCDYCISHHAEALRFYLKNGDQLDSLRRDGQLNNIPPRAKALIDFALKLTLEPGKMARTDVEALGKVGVSDSEILDLVLLTGYINFVNRVAQGLGVEHDEQEARGYRY